jgi:hypothetical protein
MRRSVCFPPGTHGSRHAAHRRRSPGRIADVPSAGHSGGSKRRRHRPVRRCDASRRGRDPVARAPESHPLDRSGRMHGARRARSSQSAGVGGRRASWPVLRARSVVAARLHDRGQRRGELGRRSLPEIRPDGAQRSGLARIHDRGRASRARRYDVRRSGTGSARAGARLGGSVARGHRGHTAARTEAAARAGRHGLIRRRGQGRRRCGGDHRCRHHPRGSRDDGPQGDECRRAFRQGRLRPGRGSHSPR